MVDDHTQRPVLRPNEPAARSAPAKASPSGNDPLAELARLIGQNDPFSEFGRDANRRVAPPPQPQELAHDWDAQPAGAGMAPPRAAEPRAPQGAGNDYYDQAPVAAPQSFAPSFGRQPFGGAPLAGGDEPYRDNEVPGYPAQQGGYEDNRYDPNDPSLAPEERDFYDDEPPSRRRMGILVIAGVFALAVIGTAGAFGYRALFGSSSVSGPPPVIKADTAPSKIVPAAAQSGKQITDRVNDKGIGEKLVSREEQPVAVTPQSPDQSSAPAMGSGIVGSEPKKVRTIAIHPDQPPTVDAAPAPQPQQLPRVIATTPQARPAAAPQSPPPQAPLPRVVSTSPPAADPELAPALAPAPRAPAARTAPPAQQAQASANVPLSLSPDAAPARPAPAAHAPAAPARTAAVTPSQPAPAVASAGGYAVQVSSQRSEAEAQAAFRSLQGKFPGQLGGKQPIIRKVELGEKGTYYRAMVLAGSSAEATELCNGMKAAGGSCIIQRN
jgi:hypothetical protein